MKTWKMHWDRQLYKALEHQYQMGLEALNENLPEIKVELVFRYIKQSHRSQDGNKTIVKQSFRENYRSILPDLPTPDKGK